MTEFSRRVNIQIIKDEPLSREEWAARLDDTQPDTDEAYQRYLHYFQPYRFRAVGANNEPLAHGESYFHEDGCLNAIDLLFADDTTVYLMPMYGEERGERLLRFGITDRNAQVDDSPDQAE